jgi:hypothetical protein
VLRDYSVSQQELKVKVPAPAPAVAYLRQLYRKIDLICVGRTTTNFQTLPLDLIPGQISDLSEYEFVNPSPMSALSGLTDEGNSSAHCKSNTGPRVYGVVEFDGGMPVEHAAILSYLGSKLPLVMMVFSGNKSLHGWFKTSHVTDENFVREFYQTAVSLGADSRMFSACQFTRLPMGTHPTTGRQQQVIHFNPENVYHVETR